MSFFNYIPGVAHAKALTHLVLNDKEGAERTMETFHTKTPIVAHLTAGIAKLAGDDETAEKCWDGGNSSLNALPAVGHVKGVVHYACGDVDGGNKAMKAATRNTVVMGAGAGGFLIGGPEGAVAGGVRAGAEWDRITAAVTDGKKSTE